MSSTSADLRRNICNLSAAAAPLSTIVTEHANRCLEDARAGECDEVSPNPNQPNLTPPNPPPTSKHHREPIPPVAEHTLLSLLLPPPLPQQRPASIPAVHPEFYCDSTGNPLQELAPPQNKQGEALLPLPLPLCPLVWHQQHTHRHSPRRSRCRGSKHHQPQHLRRRSSTDVARDGHLKHRRCRYPWRPSSARRRGRCCGGVRSGFQPAWAVRPVAAGPKGYSSCHGNLVRSLSVSGSN